MNPNAAPRSLVRANRKGSMVAPLAKAAALSVIIAILVRALRGADFGAALALIGRIGASGAVVLLPFAVAMGLDALAQSRILRGLGLGVRYRPLYAARLAAEAVSMSAPAGAVFAETVNPVLLKRSCGVPYDAAVAANAVKRWLTIRAQTGYIVLGVVLGGATLSHTSRGLLGHSGLVWIVLGTALIPLAASSVLGATLFGGSASRRVGQALGALPNKRLRAFIEARRAAFANTDEKLGTLSRAGATLWPATALLFGGWLLESVDTLVVLRVLGAPLSFSDVIGFEAGLALVRNLAFFAPAGLGVQDLGYVAFLGALSIPGATTLAAAFIMLKRAKEVLWILFGYALLVLLKYLPTKAIAPKEALS